MPVILYNMRTETGPTIIVNANDAAIAVAVAVAIANVIALAIAISKDIVISCHYYCQCQYD